MSDAPDPAPTPAPTPDTDPDTNPDLAAARSRIYALLAAAFDGDVERLAAAMETDVFERLAAAVPGDPDVGALASPSLDPEALRIGYDNLFVVPGPHYVPPFGSGYVVDPSEASESDSVYCDDGSPGELLGRPAASAASVYERFGFTPTRGADFPDSLPALLEFMSALAAAERRATGAAEVSRLREVQSAVVADQLSWLDPFADAVAAKDAAEGVYAALTDLTRAFVAADRARLCATVGGSEIEGEGR